jgi:dihydroneopterin aldolase
MGTDRIVINDLEVWTHIGVPAEERATEQRLLVTVECMLDTRAAAKGDDVKKSINYLDVSNDIHKLARKERKTIERFAEDVATMVQRNYKPEGVAVTVKKFALPGARDVSITITRPSVGA